MKDQHDSPSAPNTVGLQEWPPSVSPEVEVCIVAFNQVQFIAQCIEGVLRQETDFPVRITVYDDASSDGTAAVIKDYENKYPLVLRSVINPINQYSKAKFSFFYNEVCCKSEAPYIALCAGDDAWNDANKLQAQRDFLASNQRFVVCGHDCKVVDESGCEIAPTLIPPRDRRDATSDQLKANKLWISATTVMYRNVIREFPVEFGRCMHEDSWLFSFLGAHGDYHFHGDIGPSYYRKHQGGIWSKQPKRLKQAEWCNSMYWLSSYYRRVGSNELAEHFMAKFSEGFYHLEDTQELLWACWRRLSDPLTWQGALTKIYKRK